MNEINPFPGTFPGTVKAPLDIPSITEIADVVCQGIVTDVIHNEDVQYMVGHHPAWFARKTAKFKVDIVHKGQVTASEIEISFLKPSFSSSMETLEKDEHVLIFLKITKTHYEFANLTTSKLAINT